jgi:hypothetical protein
MWLGLMQECHGTKGAIWIFLNKNNVEGVCLYPALPRFYAVDDVFWPKLCP